MSFSSILLQHSPEILKNYYSLAKCAFLRENIDQHSETISSDKSIADALHQIEQLYDSLAIINQFFHNSYFMPAPHQCINQLTYRLAIVFFQVKIYRRTYRYFDWE